MNEATRPPCKPARRCGRGIMNYKIEAKNWLIKIGKFLADLIFPVQCLGCQRSGKWLCERCYYQVKSRCLPSPIYLKKSHLLNRLIVPFSYSDPLVRKLITVYKYHFVQEISEILSRLLTDYLKPFFKNIDPQNFILIPVPLHKKRLRFRGFNQSELLAKHITEEFNLPLASKILTRCRNTIPQVQLKEKERQHNIHEAFAICKDHSLLENKIVILLDDVFTSGATLEECARILRHTSHPRAIWALAVAKG